ncbi:hypothetical protein VM1G_08750 [Cytospora mali]|uniref:Uncharacterized protein n=1 Tax=Cytospora mali TaxID=578113 RepID=A0A194WA86_CYTMA|nr:hypothetical protein VM1G_08750 [Valsa mali]
MEGVAAPVLSQASSHSPLDPVSGVTLFEQEKKRRDGLKQRGNCLTGCRELDHEVLLGGFERGCVVGISAEEEEVGLLIGLQTIANLFVAGLRSGSRSGRTRAMIITTSSMSALLPVLRDAFKAQLAAHGEGDVGFDELLKQFLERISISRVFDVFGLWEVLKELDGLANHGDGGANQEPPSSQHEEDTRDDEEALERHHTQVQGGIHGEDTATEAAEPFSSPLSDPPSSLPEEFEFEANLPRKTQPPGQRIEIADSEDEEGFLSSLSPAKESRSVSVEAAKSVSRGKPPGKQASEKVPFSEQKPDVEQSNKEDNPIHPDLILITHISTLISSLFNQREKDTAHQTLQLLSSHLRYLTRSPHHGGPLVIILNSTTSPSDSANSNDTTTTADRLQDPERPPRPTEPGTKTKTKTSESLDPTLRSIFNPPPLRVTGLNYKYDTPLSRRNKPFYGLIFTQLLDQHLLCTRVPKTRADAEALFGRSSQVARGESVVEYGWVVEVLLDEVGVWEVNGAEEGRPRRSREQRWGAVDVRRDGGGVRVVDAFERGETVAREIRLAGGFGGRRV